MSKLEVDRILTILMFGVAWMVAIGGTLYLASDIEVQTYCRASNYTEVHKDFDCKDHKPSYVK